LLSNRIIVILAIILSGIFASFYRGIIPRMFFYITLLIPIFAIIYIFYVYLRFKIFQTVDARITTKGEKIRYKLTLVNEDIISYTNVKINFVSKKCLIDDANFSKSHCFTPGEKVEIDTAFTCLYRGRYNIGVETIDIADFLNIFKIRFPSTSKVNIKVLPRIIQLDELTILPIESDIKNSKSTVNSVKENLDIDMRKYTLGDSKKIIHWKASAKKNELFTRKYSENPRSEIAIIMDLTCVSEPEITAVIVEDKIIESTLAVVDYFSRNKTQTTVFFEWGKNSCKKIVSKKDFDYFYNLCAEVDFESKKSAGQILSISNQLIKNQCFSIVLTHKITAELCRASYEAICLGNDVTIIYINDGEPEENLYKLDIRVKVKKIGINDEIAQAIGGTRRRA